MESDPIFNTDHLQTYPDYFTEAPLEPLLKKNNNNRYKFFKQNHFTAGDEDQFLEFWDRSTPKLKKTPPGPLATSVSPNIQWIKYKDLCTDDVIHTYHYMADKFKKGIFFKITDGDPKVFIPFSKVDYQNEWSDKIATNPRRFTNIVQLMRYTAEVESREFIESKVHKNVKAWYGNNGLVRLEFPTSEGDSGVNMLRDMMVSLCKERDLPSVELFINKRDFPLLKKDDTESYDSFFGKKTRLQSHLYDRYVPILSMTTTPLHADIPIPTWEDWSRVAYWNDGKLFSKEFRRFPKPEEFDTIPWEERIPTAIFRGASTGLGTTTENNIRLFISAESQKKIRDPEDGILLLDAGITKWNLRPRKHPLYPFIETIHVEEMPFSLAPNMSPLEQARYKYILHLPGHSEAYRLGLELFSGSVILYFPCEYQLWYFNWLEPWKHYVPLTGTLQDIYDKIRWCKTHDEECKTIAKNAREFAERHLTRRALLDYLQATFWAIHKFSGEIVHLPRNLNDINIDLYHQIRNLQWSVVNPPPSSVSLWRQKIHHVLDTDKSFIHQLSKEMIQLLLMMDVKNLLQEDRPIKESKNTSLSILNYHDKKFAAKKTTQTWKSEEKFQSLCGYLFTNDLSKICPHFIYTYLDYETEDQQNMIVTDYVEGPTMEDFINSNTFKIGNLVDILQLLCLGLHTAQQFCSFLHMDLYPWNIVMQKQDPNTPCEYNIDGGSISISGVGLLPVMIDYGKSHFVYHGVNYYNSSPFYYCRFQDVLSILLSSLHIFLEKHKLVDADIKIVLKLMNFFSQTDYTQKTTFSNIGHVKSFLKKHKKYSKMLGEPKLGLEDKTPLDFFYFLRSFQLPSTLRVQFSESILSFSDHFHWNGGDPTLMKIKQMVLEVEALSLFKWDISRMELRQLWLRCEDLWTVLDQSLPPAYHYILAFHLQKLFDKLSDLIVSYEKTYTKVWDNLDFEDLRADLPMMPSVPPLPKVQSLDWSILHTMPLPTYPTHVCKICPFSGNRVTTRMMPNKNGNSRLLKMASPKESIIVKQQPSHYVKDPMGSKKCMEWMYFQKIYNIHRDSAYALDFFLYQMISSHGGTLQELSK